MGEIRFYPGDRVIVRNNKYTEKFSTGTYLRPWSKKHPHVPIIKIDGVGETICHGLVVSYSKELAETLEAMPHKEQWNYLIKGLVSGTVRG